MKVNSNIPELIKKLEQVRDAIGGSTGGEPIIPDFSDALFSALNAGMGKMKFRIFNKGLDVSGESLGTYTKQYAKRRTKAGRQTVYKDLEFEGSLRRSIETVRTDNKEVVVAIVNEKTAAISGYQEEQTGKTIFQFSEDELAQTQAEADAAVDQVIAQLMEA